MKNRKSSPKGNTQNPWIPRGLYNILSRANRVNIWTIGLSCFVSIFTFWLGLSCQYIIVNNNRKEAQTAVHFNMLSYTTKHKEDYNSKIEDIIVYNIDMAYKELVKDTIYLDTYKEEFLIKNWNTLVQNIKEGIDISERAKYYFPEKQFRKITFNNLKIAEILDEYYSIIDTSKVNFYIDFNFLLLQNKGESDFNKELEDSLNYFRSNYALKLSNIKNEFEDKYKIWRLSETVYLSNQRSKESNDSIANRMTKVIDLALADESLDKDLVSRLQEQNDAIKSQQVQLNEKVKELLIIGRSQIITEIVLLLSENYHIINDEVTPLNVAVKQKDNEKLLIDPGYLLAALSLILIFPLGFCFWYLMIWLIFRNAEKPNQSSSDDWDRQEYLRSELVILSTIECILLNSVDREKNTKK